MSENAFPTIFDLRSTHSQLLAQQRKGVPFEQLLPNVTSFVVRARQTGALLDAEEQRTAAQGLIDYWLTKLDQTHLPFDDSTLVDFDESLAPELADDQCPYVGLEAFREKDARNFFGRRETLDKALDVIRTKRFLAVIGPSGSGKSSIVLGGLLPMLQENAIDGSAMWRYAAPFAPGSEPVKNFDAAVAAAPEGGEKLVVTIDQFEELFTLADDADARNAFAKKVAEVVAKDGVVIATIREDYIPRLGAHPELQDLFRNGDLRATPLSAAELREAIEKPAERINLKFESGLVDALVSDVVGEPAALPLLQFTLWRLWTKRRRNRIVFDTYREVGGGRSALARAADEVYDDLKIVQNQDTMRRILLRMVRPGAHAETTSSRVRVSALLRIGDDPGRVQAVLDKLLASRLVRRTAGETPDDDQIEVAHEALIRNWPKLVEWTEQKKAAMTELRRFEALADEWERFGRQYGFLDEEQLKEAEEWLKSDEAKEIGVKETLPQLIEASRKLIGKRRRAERRAKAILVLLIVAIIGVLTWAVVTQRKALQAADEHNAALKQKQADLQNKINELTKTKQALRAEESEKNQATELAQRLSVGVIPQLGFDAPQEFQKPRQLAKPEALGLLKESRPIRLGSSVGFGSACCLVHGRAGDRYLLTAGLTDIGTSVDQPGGSSKVIGTVDRLGSEPQTSGALVRLNPDVYVDLTLPNLGTIAGVAKHVRRGDQVRSVGRGSGLSAGRVLVIRDGYIITSIDTANGDAGAPVVNSRNELVGIIYGSLDKTSLVLPIEPILRELKVTLVTPTNAK